MKVVHLTSHLSRSGGGVSSAVQHLAKANTERLDKLEVIGLRTDDACETRQDWTGVALTISPTRGPGSFGYSPTLTTALLGADPDLVHRHGLWMYPSWASSQWQARTGRPVVVSPHGMLEPWALRNSWWKKRIASALFERGALNRASCLHALTLAEAESIRSFGLRNPIAVIPNGVTIPQSTVRRTPPWQHVVPAEQNVLLYLGRIHPIKGLSTLLTALASVQGHYSAAPWRLVVIGWDEGGHEQKLRRLARQLGLSSRVHWLGPRFNEEKAAAFSNADAFVLPSQSEGLPMAALEAWSYGLPVLMTEHCNLQEGLEAGAAYLLRDNIAGMAEDLLTFFDLAEGELKTAGAKGRVLVKERFSWEKVAAQMEEVYRWLHGASTRPSHVVI